MSPFKKYRIADYGDVSVDPFSIEETYKRIEASVDELMDAGVVPVSVGGDHGISYPLLKSVAKKHGPLAMVVVDAHPDTHDTQFGHKLAHATPFRRAVEINALNPKKVIQIGIRGTLFYEGDLEYGEKHGFRVITAEEFMSRDIEDIKSEIRKIVGTSNCYLSIDIDGLDASVAPGTGAPEIGGLNSYQTAQVIRSLAGLKVVGADIVEVSPPLDAGHMTSILGAHLLFEMLCVVWK